MTMLQGSEIGAVTSGGPFGQPPQSKYENLISLAREVPPATTVVAHPCDETLLAVASRRIGAFLHCGGRKSAKSGFCSRAGARCGCVGLGRRYMALHAEVVVVDWRPRFSPCRASAA